MRVLVVSGWEPWRTGDGACLVLHAHLRELAARHDVVLLSAGAPAATAVPPLPSRTLPVETRWYGTALPRPVDAAVRRLTRGDEPAHVAYVARRRLVADLRQEVSTRRPDVVHLFGWGTAALHRHLAGVPAVHDAVDPWAATRDNRARSRAGRLLDTGEAGRVAAHEARHYPRLHAVVVRTEQDAALLHQQVPGARVEAVPNGVDLPAEGRPSDAPVLVFLGAYDASSNVDAASRLVRDVLPRVQVQVPAARVLLVGRDPGPVAGLGAETTGRVDDVPAALRRGAVLVAPMATGRGVKNKVLEAMAAGLPVVTSPLGAQGVDAGEGVVVADGPDAQAAAVVRLLQDAALRHRLGADNRARAATLTWAASAARVERLWREAAAAPCAEDP